MSLSLAVYLVDLDKLRGTIGGGDDKLRRQICGRFKADLERADEWFASNIAEGAPRRYDAIKALFAGGPFDARFGFQYGYAYEMVAQHLGKFLDNNHVSSFRGDWLELVDGGLKRLGMTVEVTSFMVGSLPDPLPRPDDFPGHGEWTREQCREALAQWEASAPRRSELEPEVLDAVEACVAWLRAVEARPGAGIAGFGY